MRGSLTRVLRPILWAALLFMGVGSALAGDTLATEAQELESVADLLRMLVPGDLGTAIASSMVDTSSSVDTASGADTAPLRVPSAEVPPLGSELESLRERLRRVLGLYYSRQLNTSEHNPWEMMHAIIAYGVQTQIHRGGPSGEGVNAVSYVCWNGPCHGLSLLHLDRGRINARKGPYVQGHYGQFLAILAQSRVPRDYPLNVGGKSFTLEDLIATEKLTCVAGMELTFKLISFAHYCDLDETWKNEKGETWSIPRLIAEELKAPILSNAPCGGTHRLTALAYAVHNRQAQGKPIDGQWLNAQKYLEEYHRYTLALQNSDGSFSTEWFRRREARPDLNRRLQTTGHILEWLVYSLPVEKLDDPRVIKAVDYLSGILLDKQSFDWEIGPLGHAIHALAIYDQRFFKPHDAPAATVTIQEVDSQVPRLGVGHDQNLDAAAETVRDQSDGASNSGAPVHEARLAPATRKPTIQAPPAKPASEQEADGPALTWP